MRSAASLVPDHLRDFLARHEVVVEFLAPGVPMPTVPAAAAAIGVPEEQILKTVLFANRNGECVVAIASGVRRIDRVLLGAAAGVAALRVAPPAEVLAVTGYPAGGVSPLALPDTLAVIIDTAVVDLPIAYGGGGHEDVLLKISPADIVRLNQAVVATIVTSH
jgi:prolyl-tRNA editing enzyme YbaK/EbsC (Cys-tRNA(Pro) deacylase)